MGLIAHSRPATAYRMTPMGPSEMAGGAIHAQIWLTPAAEWPEPVAGPVPDVSRS
jgi:hypothetical protein